MAWSDLTAKGLEMDQCFPVQPRLLVLFLVLIALAPPPSAPREVDSAFSVLCYMPEAEVSRAVRGL